MRYQALRVNGASLHIAELGEGAPLLLLHGWPEFWLTWEPVMLRLAKRYRLVAPDLRGFGDSDKPDGPFGAADHATDMLALLDALGIRQAGIVGHDVGGAAMQPLARKAPERVAGLFFFDFVYPGIGPRMAAPDRLNEIWYQSFNQMDMAPALVGASRLTCRDVHFVFPASLVTSQECVRRCPPAFHGKFSKAGKSGRGLCPLPRELMQVASP